MAFRNLSIDEMLALSVGWTDPKRGRAHIERVPLLAGLLPELDRAHQGLLDLLRPRHLSPLAEALIDLGREAAEVDVRHDRKGRGAWWVLSGLAELTDDPAMVGVYNGLQKRLFPDGVEVVERAYLAEAESASRLAKELNEGEVREALRAIPLPGGGCLLDAMEALVTAGLHLGRLEARRAELVSEHGVVESAPQPRGAVLKARNAWVEAADALVANLSLASGVDEEIERLIAQPIRDAEGQADRRGTR